MLGTSAAALSGQARRIHHRHRPRQPALLAAERLLVSEVARRVHEGCRGARAQRTRRCRKFPRTRSTSTCPSRARWACRFGLIPGSPRSKIPAAEPGRSTSSIPQILAAAGVAIPAPDGRGPNGEELSPDPRSGPNSSGSEPKRAARRAAAEPARRPKSRRPTSATRAEQLGERARTRRSRRARPGPGRPRARRRLCERRRVVTTRNAAKPLRQLAAKRPAAFQRAQSRLGAECASSRHRNLLRRRASRIARATLVLRRTSRHEPLRHSVRLARRSSGSCCSPRRWSRLLLDQRPTPRSARARRRRRRCSSCERAGDR